MQCRACFSSSADEAMCRACFSSSADEAMEIAGVCGTKVLPGPLNGDKGPQIVFDLFNAASASATNCELLSSTNCELLLGFSSSSSISTERTSSLEFFSFFVNH